MSRPCQHPLILALALAGVLSAVTAHAQSLIANGSLSGTFSDLSGLAGPLENGVAGNLLV